MAIKTGEKMYAADILNLTFFPKGTILTFSTEAWNNATNPGFKDIWKICDGQNGTPNLVNMFLRGAGSSGATGGANSQSVTAAQLPAHNHGATGLSVSGLSLSPLSLTNMAITGLTVSGGGHEHTLSGGTASEGNHTHNTHTGAVEGYDAGRTNVFANASGVFSVSGDAGRQQSSDGSARDARYQLSINAGHNTTGSHSHDFTSTSKAVYTSHEHTISGGTITGSIAGGAVTGGSISGSTANAGSSSALVINTVPSYYTVIYIMKVV
jgi:hypothetical protein